jgi:DNA-binding transcriptional MerR regulator
LLNKGTQKGFRDEREPSLVYDAFIRKHLWRRSVHRMVAKKKTGKNTEIVIPDRLYFRIGEVASLTQLPAYVLRFWETEFSQLKPVKGSTGQRMYRQKDVELIVHIKQLLYDQGFTIPGAREQLKAEAKPTKAQFALELPKAPRTDQLKHVRQGLHEILQILKTPVRDKRVRAKA